MKRTIASLTIWFSVAFLHASNSFAQNVPSRDLPVSGEALANLWDALVSENFVMFDSSDTRDRIHEIILRLAADLAHGNANYRVRLINDSAPLNFPLPPNRIYVSTGLLDVMTNEGDLAALLALQLAYLTEDLEYDVFTADLSGRNVHDILSTVVSFGALAAGSIGSSAFGAAHAGEGAAAAAGSWSDVWSHALEVQLPSVLMVPGGPGAVGAVAARAAQEAGQRLPMKRAVLNRLAPLLGRAEVDNVIQAAIFSLFQAAYTGYDRDSELRCLERASNYLDRSGYDPASLIIALKILLLIRKEALSRGHISALFLAEPGLESRLERLINVTAKP
jgi:predicted Zn-dependent protease